MLLGVTFLLPGILMAATAGAAPVIIHLMMRTKPRKVVFPALRFVKKTHRANLSKLRLKHLILLAMRIAIIVLAAALIARAQIPRFRQVSANQAPAAVVVVVDTSGSMAYRAKGQPALAYTQEIGARLIGSLPQGSTVATITVDSATGNVAFLKELRLVRDGLVSMSGGASGSGLGTAVKRATELLAQQRQARKEVYILTDLTRRAWRDLTALPQQAGIEYTIVHCPMEQAPNVALAPLELGQSSLPLGADLSLRPVLQASQMGGQFTLRAELDGKTLDQKSVTLASGGSAVSTLTVKPQREGTIHGRVAIAEEDPLTPDNSRYFTLKVAPPGKVLAVVTQMGDPVSILMKLAISPPDSSFVNYTEVDYNQLPSQDLAGVGLVLLADVASLPAPQWERLEKYVRDGGHVWVVPGTFMGLQSYNSPEAQKLLPCSFGAMQKLPAKVSLSGVDLRDPMVRVFAQVPNLPLEDVRAEQRLSIASTASDAQVVLRYADSVPAIVQRRLGAGSVLVWNIAPGEGLSNLHQLVQGAMLTQSALRLLVAGQQVQRQYEVGQAVTLPLPAGMPGPTVLLIAPGQAESSIQPDMRARIVTVAAGKAGHYTVTFVQEGRREEVGFSVNMPMVESDLTPLDASAVLAKFPPQSARIIDSQDKLDALAATVKEPLDLTAPLLLGLLALLVGESFFANRFYRKAATSALDSGQNC